MKRLSLSKGKTFEWVIVLVFVGLCVICLISRALLIALVGLALLLFVVWLVWDFRLRAQQGRLAGWVMNEIQAVLVGRSLPGFDLQVKGISGWYGSSVWILLQGEDEGRLPAWLSGEALEQSGLDSALRDALTDLQQETLALFYQGGWQRGWPLPSIGFIASTRLASTPGGIGSYFR